MAIDAIVFVPGVGREPFGAQSMSEGLASRLARALDDSLDLSGKFSTKQENIELGHGFGQTDYVTVSSVATPGADAVLLADAFTLDLPDLLIRPYENQGSKARAWSLGVVLLMLQPRLLRVLRRNRTKKLNERFELLVGAAIYCVLLLAFLATLLLVVAAFIGSLTSLGSLEFLRDWFLVPAALVMFAASSIPPTWRKAINSNLVVALVLVNYITAGSEKDVATGKLNGFINELVDSHRYQSIHVIAYSIGSLIVLDALYPTAAPLSSMSKVNSLATIGCPADFIQTYWPAYFSDRLGSSSLPDWLNIFEPGDLLASNFIIGDNFAESVAELADNTKAMSAPIRFRNSSEERIPQRNHRYSTTGETGTQAHLISAMKLHRIYWDAKEPRSSDVFDLIAETIKLGRKTGPLASGGGSAVQATQQHS